MATVEDLTGIKLDHFVEFDFNSFRTMVDSLGGVEVCVPPGPGYHDHYSHLNLNPGKHLLKYNQALAYVRTRHGVGSGADAGGDLPRIQLQQAFISSIVQKVQSQGLLSNLPSLYGVAKTATRALTVDDGLGSASSLVHLAESLTQLRSEERQPDHVADSHGHLSGPARASDGGAAAGRRAVPARPDWPGLARPVAGRALQQGRRSGC